MQIMTLSKTSLWEFRWEAQSTVGAPPKTEGFSTKRHDVVSFRQSTLFASMSEEAAPDNARGQARDVLVQIRKAIQKLAARCDSEPKSSPSSLKSCSSSCSWVCQGMTRAVWTHCRKRQVIRGKRQVYRKHEQKASLASGQFRRLSHLHHRDRAWYCVFIESFHIMILVRTQQLYILCYGVALLVSMVFIIIVFGVDPT